MQFRSIITLGLVGVACAAPTIGSVAEKRQASAIIAALDPVKATLNQLSTSVKGITPGNVEKQTADLTTKSKAVEKALVDGKAKVESASTVSVVEAVQVQSASTALTKLTTQIIDDLIAKKPDIVKGGQAKTVVQNLNSQKAASDAFIAAIVTKVPAAVQMVAKSLTAEIGTALQKGVTAFS